VTLGPSYYCDTVLIQSLLIKKYLSFQKYLLFSKDISRRSLTKDIMYYHILHKKNLVWEIERDNLGKIIDKSISDLLTHLIPLPIIWNNYKLFKSLFKLFYEQTLFNWWILILFYIFHIPWFSSLKINSKWMSNCSYR